MLSDLDLAQRFGEFVDKYKIFLKIETELSGSNLDLVKLNLGKEAVLLPVLMDLTGRIGESLSVDKRAGLIFPEVKAGEKLTGDMVNQMADFVLKAAPVLGEERLITLVDASVKDICSEIVINYKNKGQ